MKKANTGKQRGIKSILAFLMSLTMLLTGMAATAATAENTQYFNADGWVIVEPSATPTESPVPDGARQAAVDDITFSVSPDAQSAVFGADFSVARVKDEAALADARTAYADAFGADSLTDGTELRLYQLQFSSDGNAITVPDGLAVTASAAANVGFVPARGAGYTGGSAAASVGDPAKVEKTNDAWQTTVVLTNADTLLLAARPAGETPTPTETPAAGEGVYTYEDGSIRLTAEVGGALPPENAEFFVTSLGDATVPASDGNLQSILAYHVGFRVPEGELGADAPLSIQLDVLTDASTATELVNAQGDVLWQKPEGANSAQSFTFQLAVGGSFVLAGPASQPEPTPEPQPATLTYEDDAITLTATADDASPLPEGAALAVTPVADAADETAGETSSQTLLGYRVTLTDAQGATLEGITPALSLTVKDASALSAATALVAGDGSVLWQAAEGATQAPDQPFTFTLQNGDVFRLTAPAAVPEATQAAPEQAGVFTYEDASLRLTATVADPSAIPQGVTLTASVSNTLYSAYADRLQAQGIGEARTGWLSTVTPSFMLDGQPVDIGQADVSYALLVKGVADPQAQRCLVLPGDLPASDAAYSLTQDGLSVQFTAQGAPSVGLALVQPKQSVFSFENDDLRVTVTVGDPEALPDNATFTAALSGAAWADYAAAMEAVSVDETRIASLATLTAGFTAGDTVVDTAGVPMTYDLFLKGQQYQGTKTLYAIADGTAAAMDAFSPLADGLSAQYQGTGALSVGLAAVLPKPIALTYEDDALRLTLTVPDETLIPTGAQLTAAVTPAEWATYADRLQATGLDETGVQRLLSLTATLTADGQPVNTAGMALQYSLLLKGEQADGLVAWVANAETVAKADSLTQTDEGAAVTFETAGDTALGLALATPKFTQYTFEDDTLRLRVTLPEDVQLPQDALLSVTHTPGVWADYAKRLQAQGYDETRVMSLINLNVGFTLNGQPVSMAGVPMACELLYKNQPFDTMQGWTLTADAAQAVETFTTGTEGATATFTLTDAPEIGLAVTLPGRTVYTYEDDQIYVVATLSDPSAIPEGSTLLVTPVTIDETLQPYVDMLQQANDEAKAAATDSAQATQSPDANASSEGETTTDIQTAADSSVLLPGYAAYDIRFELNGVEYEPEAGKVNISISQQGATAFDSAASDVKVIHLKEQDGAITPEILDANVQQDSDASGGTIDFNTNSFSVVILPTMPTDTTRLKYTSVSSTSTPTFVNSEFYFDTPLGIAGNFLITAFTKATIGADTNGNILAAAASVGAQRISSRYALDFYELNYINQYDWTSDNSNIGGDFNPEHKVLALGASNLVSVNVNNSGPDDDYFVLTSGTKTTRFDKMFSLYQDTNDTSPYINLATVKSDMSTLSEKLKGYSENYDTITGTSEITVNAKAGEVNVININAANANTAYITSAKKWFVNLPNLNTTVIVNVDCSSFTGTINMPGVIEVVNGVQKDYHERTSVSEYNDGLILWNFYNAKDRTISAQAAVYASILIDGNGGTFTTNSNVDGSMIADNVNPTGGETHRNPFVGKLTAPKTIEVTKVWKDVNGNVITPPTGSTATIQFYKNAGTSSSPSYVTDASWTVELNAGNSWTADWTLPVTGYDYYAKEIKINNVAVSSSGAYDFASGSTSLYGVTYSGNTGVRSGTITVTNKQKEVTTYTVTKVWQDANGANYSGTTPPVTLNLMQGSTVYDSVTLPQNSSLSYTFINLPKYSSGTTPYMYSVQEATPATGAGYTLYSTNSASGTVVNRLVSAALTLTKTWDDTGFTASRPASVNVTLTRYMADGTTQDSGFTPKSYTLSSSTTPAWSTTTEALPEGYFTSTYTYQKYVYKISETAPTGYVASYPANLSVKNTYQTKTVSVTKIWKDSANAAGTLTYPTSGPAFTVNVLNPRLAAGQQVVDTLIFTANDTNLTKTSKALPKYDATGEIPYTVEEVAPIDYTKSGPTETTPAGQSNQTFSITNTRIETSKSVVKTWDNSQYSGLIALVRPKVIYTLYANGVSTGRTLEVAAGSADTAYNVTFNHLPQYDTSGEITYSVREALYPSANAAYSISFSGMGVTNKLAVKDVTVTKNWLAADGSSFSGTKPSVVIELWQTTATDTTGAKIATYTLPATEASHKFTNLPAYAADGTAYIYIAKEQAVDGFTPTYSADKLTVTNTQKATSIRVTKNWSNGSYSGSYSGSDGIKRPALTVYLLNGDDRNTVANNAGTYTFTAGVRNTDTYTFTNLPEGHYVNGQYTLYVYQVVEQDAVTGYTTGGPATAQNSYTLTNTLQTTSITVSKTWVMAGGDTAVPAVRFNLLRDGEIIATNAVAASQTTPATYSWSWNNLPVVNPATGALCTYTVQEIIDPTTADNNAVAGNAANAFTQAFSAGSGTATVQIAAGPTAVISGSGTASIQITNTQKKISLSGTKSWKAGTDDYTLVKPSVTVELKRDGNSLSPARTQTILFNSSNPTYQFTDLPQMNPTTGVAYAYSVTETPALTGFTPTYSATANNLDIVNQLDMIHVVVNKTWADSADANADTTYASQSVTVQLMRRKTSETVSTAVPGVNARTFTGSTTFDNLPAGVVEADGSFTRYLYTVEETALPGFTATVTPPASANGGGDQTVAVLNTRTRINVGATKQWMNNAGATQTPPTGASVTFQLWRSVNGGAAEAMSGRTVVLDGKPETASGNVTDYENTAWHATFTGLATYGLNGDAYTYTVKEQSVPAGFRVLYAQGSTAYETLVNNLQTALRVAKVSNPNSEPLANAGFTITNKTNPTETYALPAGQTVTSWDWTGLSADTEYTLTETTTPAGYFPASAVDFKISSADGNVYTKDASQQYTVVAANHQITVTDDPIVLYVAKLNGTGDSTLTLSALKTLMTASPERFLNHAVLTLYSVSGATETPVQTLTLDADPAAAYYQLGTAAHPLVAGGQYILRETTAPDYYKKAADISFTVDKTMNNFVLMMYDEPIQYKTFEVKKTWNGGAGKNVTFDLYMGPEGSRTLLETVTLSADDADATVAFQGSTAIKCKNGQYPMTDADGNPIEYTVTERAVDGYITGPMALDTANSTDTLARYAITNTPVTVTFSKKAMVGSDELPGASLALYLGDGSVTDAEHTVASWTSGSDGVDGNGKLKPHVLIGELTVGQEYTLTETTAPNGYAVTESVRFTVNADGSLTAVGTSPDNTNVGDHGVTMRDKPLNLTVSKTTMGGVDLPGAKLTLTDTTDQQTVATWTGVTSGSKAFSSTIALNAGNYEYTYNSDEQEYPLIAGHTYRLVEDQAPLGYLVATEVNFILNEDGTATLLANSNGVVSNAADSATVTLKDDQSSLLITKKTTGGAVQSNAKFVLYYYDAQAANHLGSVAYPLTQSDPAIVTDANGEFTLRGLHHNTAYVLVETEAPEGYAIADPITFTYLDNDHTDTQPTVAVTDSLAYFRVRKVDSDMNPVAGATLGIYNAAGTTKLASVTSVGASTGNEQGWVTVDTESVSGLSTGESYILREISPPAGYSLNATDVPFTFGTDNQTTVQVSNEKLELYIDKTDIAGSPVVGAHLQITDNTLGGTLVDEWDTAKNADGSIVSHPVALSKLIAGHTYTLTETLAPDGYARAESIQFRIANDGAVSLVNENNGSLNGATLTMQDGYTTVELVKQNANQDKLTAARFTLYRSNAQGDAIEAIGSAGVKFEKLASGYYLLRETTVPDGYVAMADLPFQFTYDGATGATTFVVNASRATDDVQTSLVNGYATVTVTDAPTLVKVRKVNAATPAVAIAGATLAVYTDDNGKPGDPVPNTTFVTSLSDPTATGDDKSVHVYDHVLTAGVQYWLVEESVSDNTLYALAEPVPFTVGETADPVEVTMVNRTLELTLYKLDSGAYDAQTGAYTGNPVDGIDLTLTGPQRKTDGTVVTDGTWTWNTSNVNPKTLTLADGLIAGKTYTLSEDPASVKPTHQYADPITFTLSDYGGSKSVVMVDALTGTVKVEVTKQWWNAAHTSKLADSELRDTLTQVSVVLKRTVPGGTAETVGTYNVLKSNGWKLTIDDLPKADQSGKVYTYTVEEQNVPTGFALNGVGDNQGTNGNFAYTVDNDAYEATFSKRDLDSGDELLGATLRILDANQQELTRWTSDGTPHVVTGILTPNTDYFLEEVGAPDGYTVTTTFAFHLDENMVPSVQNVTAGGVDENNVVYMSDAATSVSISKRILGTATELPGAVFSITPATAATGFTNAFTWTSGSDGTDASGNLKPHTLRGLLVGTTYTLSETQPNGYIPAPSINFTVDSHGVIRTKLTAQDESEYAATAESGLITVYNTPVTVTFSKTALVGSDELPGAKLALYLGDGSQTDTAHTVATWTSGTDGTDDSGKLKPHILTGQLIVGQEYTLTETTAPYGYAVTESVRFIVNADGTIAAVGTPPTLTGVGAHSVTMKDQPTLVRFSKTTLTKAKEIANAQLTLTDITPDQDQLDGDALLSWSWSSGSQPHEIKGDLRVGHTFTLEEKRAPDGYTLAETITFTLRADGVIVALDAQGQPVTNADGELVTSTNTVLMFDAETKLSIAKVDDQQTPKPVPGATLKVFKVASQTDTTLGQQAATVITDSNGLADVTGILALDQWYVVTEDLAGTPAGYTTATASAPFQLSADGTKEITLTDPRTVFRVGKLDSRDHTTLLAGATLTIYDSMVDADGKTVPNLAAAPVATVVTEAGVTTPIYGLLLGHTYFLYESVAPDGYLRNTDTYTKFEIDADGKTAVYSVDAPSSVKLRKTDAAGNAITGATLALVMGEDAVNYDPATDVINTWTSDKLTDHTEYQLLLNTPYTLVETGAPAGYTLNTAGVTFKLDDNGQVVLLRGGTADATTVDLVSMGDQSIHVVFSKNATGNLTAELPNANLKITHTDATLGEVTDDAWQTAAVNPSPHVVTTTLRADDTTVYTFTEVGAPAGYTIAGSISFKLDLNGNVKIQQPDGSFVAPADNKVVMTDAPITFLIAKQNEDGDYLAGAEFEIVPDIEGKPGETAVTGFSKIVSEDQPTEVSGLPAGSYWLVETKAPVGIDASGNPVYYKLAQPKAFTVTDELLTGDQRVTVTVTDSPTTVTVLKLDSDQLDANQNPTGNRVKDVTVTLTRKGETTVLDTFTFDGFKDWVLTPGLIEPGATYTLTETATPADYLSFGSMDFTMEADGDARWILVNTLIAKRSITVNKVWSNSAVARQPVTIDLYRSDDLTTPYRSLPLPITADSVTFDNLPDKASNGAEYTYTLAESTATGYLPGVFTGPTVSADQKAYAYTLTNKPTALVVSKMAADTATELPGATLRIVKGNGVGYADSDIVETWQSGSDGQNADGTYKSHTLYGKLEPAKQYTLLEVSAPNGYLPAVSLTFTYTPDSNGSRTLTLTDQPTRVRFGKLDNLTGTLVEGATFDVYDDAAWQSNPSTAKPVFSFTSKTTYVETVAKLTAGKLYRLVETGAPAGYQLNGATLQFRAPSDSGTATVTLSDPRIYYFAKISASTGLAVPKAKLKVTDSSGNTVIPEWTSTGEPYEFVNTDTNGEPILKSGVTYRLVEVSAPDGYELNSTAVTFTLDSKGLINGGTTVTMTNTPVDTPTDDTIDLTIHKTWVDNGNAGNTRPTAGLTVNVYRKLSTQTDYSLMMSVTVPTRNSNNWYLTILGLDRYDNSGVEYNYRAREVVPTGYTVTYANNGFTMVNTYPGNGESPTPTPITTLTPTPNASTTRVPTSVKYVDGQWVYIDDNQVPLGVVPQTGDESNYLLWGLAIVLPLLLAAMAGWFVFRKKRRDAKTGADKA